MRKVGLSWLSLMKMAFLGVVVQSSETNFCTFFGCRKPFSEERGKREEFSLLRREHNLGQAADFCKCPIRKEDIPPLALNGGSKHGGELKGTLSSRFCWRRMITFFKYSFEP